MTWRVVLSREAEKNFDALDPPVAERVVQAIRRYAESGAGDTKYLRGEDGELRLRVGDWRVRFMLDRQQGVIRVLNVRHRREAYRRR